MSNTNDLPKLNQAVAAMLKQTLDGIIQAALQRTCDQAEADAFRIIASIPDKIKEAIANGWVRPGRKYGFTVWTVTGDDAYARGRYPLDRTSEIVRAYCDQAGLTISKNETGSFATTGYELQVTFTMPKQ